jgi:hypothetical protein
MPPDPSVYESLEGTAPQTTFGLYTADDYYQLPRENRSNFCGGY